MSYLYPESPFKYHDEIFHELKNDSLRLIENKNDEFIIKEVEIRLKRLCAWLCDTPKSTTFRVNTLVTNAENVVDQIRKDISKPDGRDFHIVTDPRFPELVTLSCHDHTTQLNLLPLPREIIVDSICGVALLRGAHVFAPGVMGIPRGLKIGDKVSVYADLTGNCKKGFIKEYKSAEKIFIGNGTIKMTREDLFGSGKTNSSGIAVLMTDVVSRLPNQSDDSVLPEGSALLQNLPSIVCSRILNPQPGEIILDMCAAPGNKTTHIAALMNGTGTIVALEKIRSKVERMRILCDKFCAKNIQVFSFDSTKAASEIQRESISIGPPFNKESFDRILLDVPCSALGQRPQLVNSITVAQINSYVPLQRKLFSTAVQLLKFGGILVYSTCTITVGENEGIVSWALRSFSCLKLRSVRDEMRQLGLPEIGSSGINISGLTPEESDKLCRFGPESDTVGFFIACFVKVDDKY